MNTSKRFLILTSVLIAWLMVFSLVIATGPYATLDTAATARVATHTTSDNATSTAAYVNADKQTTTAQTPTVTPTTVPSGTLAYTLTNGLNASSDRWTLADFGAQVTITKIAVTSATNYLDVWVAPAGATAPSVNTITDPPWVYEAAYQPFTSPKTVVFTATTRYLMLRTGQGNPAITSAGLVVTGTGGPTATGVPTATKTPTPATSTPKPTVTATPVSSTYYLDDEFNGTSVDTTKWAFPQGDQGLGGHDATWDSTACTVSGGSLHIKAQVINGVESSCALWTQGVNAIPAYGHWEMRAQVPSQSGTWPAFWSVAYDRVTDDSLYVWEIDTMEAIDHVIADNQTVSWNLHVRNASGGDDDFANYGEGANTYSGYHIYAIDWRSDHITWFFDGVAVFTVTEGQVIGGNTVHIPSMRQVAVVQMALGSYSGVLDTSQLPLTMDVDYIRITP